MPKPLPKVHRVALWLLRECAGLLNDPAALKAAFYKRWPSQTDLDLAEGAVLAMEWRKLEGKAHLDEADRLDVLAGKLIDAAAAG